MSTEVTLPALGESVTEGTISRWLKTVGDTIDVDEPLVEVSTDKVDTEVPSPATGTLLEIRVQEDEDAEVGSILAIIGDASTVSTEQPTAPSPQPPNRSPSRRRPPPHRRPRPSPLPRNRRLPRRPRLPPTRWPHVPPTRPPPSTSPHWCASWHVRTTSTCPPSPALASADVSASRTCWMPPPGPRSRHRHRLSRPPPMHLLAPLLGRLARPPRRSPRRLPPCVAPPRR